MDADMRAVLTLVAFGFGLYKLISSFPDVDRAWRHLSS